MEQMELTGKILPGIPVEEHPFHLSCRREPKC